MHGKVQKHKQSNIESKADNFQAGQRLHKQAYNKPTMVCYGPLAKNITTGFLSGAEADSTFSV